MRKFKKKSSINLVLAILLILFTCLILLVNSDEVGKVSENLNKEAAKSKTNGELNNTNKKVLYQGYIDNKHYIYIEEDPIQENFEIVRIVKKSENNEKLMFIAGLPTLLLKKYDVNIKDIINNKELGCIDRIGVKINKNSNITELFLLYESNKYKIVVRLGIVDDAIVGHKIFGLNKENGKSFGDESIKDLSSKYIKWIYRKYSENNGNVTGGGSMSRFLMEFI